MSFMFPFESSGSERRNAGRIPCMEATCQFGVLTDLSKTGCKVLSKKSLSIPKDASVNVRIECNESAIIVPARPMSCRKRDDGKYDIGFEFLFVDEQMGRALIQFMRTAAVTHEYKPRKSA